MNIVLDTNVIVSGIFWSGYPEKVLSLWGEQKFQILVSEEILNEGEPDLSSLETKICSV